MIKLYLFNFNIFSFKYIGYVYLGLLMLYLKYLFKCFVTTLSQVYILAKNIELFTHRKVLENFTEYCAEIFLSLCKPCDRVKAFFQVRSREF